MTQFIMYTKMGQVELGFGWLMIIFGRVDFLRVVRVAAGSQRQ